MVIHTAPQHRRLAAVQNALTPQDAAGLLSQLAGMLGFSNDADEEPAAAEDDPQADPELPHVQGTIEGCFVRPSAEEREAEGWSPGSGHGDPSSGHFRRHRKDSLTLTAAAAGEPADRPTAAGAASHRRDCHSAAPPSPFRRYFNRDGGGFVSKMTVSLMARRCRRPRQPQDLPAAGLAGAAGRPGAGAAVPDGGGL